MPARRFVSLWALFNCSWVAERQVYRQEIFRDWIVRPTTVSDFNSLCTVLNITHRDTVQTYCNFWLKWRKIICDCYVLRTLIRLLASTSYCWIETVGLWIWRTGKMGHPLPTKSVWCKKFVYGHRTRNWRICPSQFTWPQQNRLESTWNFSRRVFSV